MVRALQYQMVRCTLHSSGLAKMWELNDNLHVHTHHVANKPIYEVENFYKYPEKVRRFLFNRYSPPWKGTQEGKYDDRRYGQRLPKDKTLPPLDFLKDLTGIAWIPQIVTNQFKATSFPYKTHYWWIHHDPCLNGIVYFNKDDEVNGTNLYKPPYEPATLEDVEPEIPKESVELLHHIKPKYNKLVVFDGVYFPHGMALNDDRYFGDTYRMNQVFFERYDDDRRNYHQRK